jgi:6-pyruvoyltetrahydropterin/6-carboxytetrahydropterin synthase
MKIAKEYRWEMGHRLSFHDGKCVNFHGHSYKARVTLEGERDENGLLVDFYDLDKIVSPLVESLDHSFALDAADEKASAAVAALGLKTTQFDGETTVENLSAWMARKIRDAGLPANIKGIAVRVYETEDAYAEHSERW